MMVKIIVGLILGGICGYAANRIMGSKKNGIIRNIALGVVGGAVGGYLGNLIGVVGGWVTGVLLAIAGSCLLVWIAGKLFK